MASAPAAEQLNLKVKSQVRLLLVRMEKKSSSKLRIPPSLKNLWMHIANDNPYILLYSAQGQQR